MDYTTFEITRAIAIALPVGPMLSLMLGYTWFGAASSSSRSREDK
jgi:hypothetical protein